MKNFVNPEIELVKFEVEDVITTSAAPVPQNCPPEV